MPDLPVIPIVSWHSTEPPLSGGKLRIKGFVEASNQYRYVVLSPGGGERLDIAGLNARPLTVLLPHRLAQLYRKGLRESDVVAVQFEHVFCFPLALLLARRLEVPLIMDVLNIESEYLQRRGTRRALRRMIGGLEKLAVRESDLILACSERERLVFVEAYDVPNGRAWVVPNGTFPPPQPLSQDGNSVIILFVGKLDYPPNREATDFLDQVLAPAMAQRVPDARIRIVGTPRPKLTSTNVECPGYVRDLTSELAQASVCVAPLFRGSGTRIKILQYLAAAKPTVATTIGAEGLELRSGEDILLEDNPDAFIDAVVDLLANRQRAVELGRRGRESILRRYDWRTIMQQHDLKLRSFLGT